MGHGSVRGKYFRSEELGYSRMRELVRDGLVALGQDPDLFGLHSFRHQGCNSVLGPARKMFKINFFGQDQDQK